MKGNFASCIIYIPDDSRIFFEIFSWESAFSGSPRSPWIPIRGGGLPQSSSRNREVQAKNLFKLPMCIPTLRTKNHNIHWWNERAVGGKTPHSEHWNPYVQQLYTYMRTTLKGSVNIGQYSLKLLIPASTKCWFSRLYRKRQEGGEGTEHGYCSKVIEVCRSLFAAYNNSWCPFNRLVQ